MQVRKPRKRRKTHAYAAASGRKHFSRKLKAGLYLLAVFIFGLMVCAASIGMGSAVKARTEVFIPTGATYAQVQDSLRSSGNIRMFKFEILSRIKGYPDWVRPGRYVIPADVTASTVVNKLRSGDQDEVRVTFNKVRTVEQLAGIVSKRIEADSASLVAVLSDTLYLSRFTYAFKDADSLQKEALRVTPENVLACFVPDTYHLYWNTDAEAFFRRMYWEFERFWNERRQKEADSLGMNRLEIISLASIVEEETNQKDERPDIASVYLNRLRRGIPLQADPTVKYAMQDFGLRRILYKHLKYPSPYNTYINKGLPPSPICMPGKNAIEAVLDFEEHDYLYFCARPTFDGYHNFARTLREHNANARAYSAELNRRNIR